MITADMQGYWEIVRRLGNLKHRAPIVFGRAVDRAATNAKTNMSKKTREKYIVKARDVKSTIRLQKANRGKLSAEVKSVGYKIPLIKFKAKPNKPKPQKPPNAYSAQVKKSSGIKPIKKGFLTNLSGSVRFMHRKGDKRLPIRQLFGPSVPDMIGNPEVMGFVEAEAMATFNKRIEHEISRVLGGA